MMGQSLGVAVCQLSPDVDFVVNRHCEGIAAARCSSKVIIQAGEHPPCPCHCWSDAL